MPDAGYCVCFRWSVLCAFLRFRFICLSAMSSSSSSLSSVFLVANHAHAVTADQRASHNTLSVDVHREFQMNCFYFYVFRVRLARSASWAIRMWNVGVQLRRTRSLREQFSFASMDRRGVWTVYQRTFGPSVVGRIHSCLASPSCIATVTTSIAIASKIIMTEEIAVQRLTDVSGSSNCTLFNSRDCFDFYGILISLTSILSQSEW